MKSIVIATVGWLVLGSAAWADSSWKMGPLTNGQVELTRGTDVFDISFRRDTIVEFNFKPGGKSAPPTPVFIGLTETVAAQQKPTGATDGVTTFTTSGMSVTVDPATLDIKIADSAGKPLCEMNAWSGVGCTVKHDHHRFFGNTGRLTAGYQGSNGGPFLWTLSGYGVLWDAEFGQVDVKDDQFTTSRRVGYVYPRPNYDCFVMLGKPRALLEDLADISGHAPMFPKWNMGFMVTRYGGMNEKEMLSCVDLFREKKIPFDTYIIDYDWFNYAKGDLGDFEWNTDNFPDGPSGKLCKELLAPKGVKMAAIRKPRLSCPNPGPATQNAIAKGWVYAQDNHKPGQPYEYNFHDKESADWWWSQERPLFESGIVGYWNDEADTFNTFHFMEMARTEYEGQRSISNQRVWTLNRNFYIGSQRYAYALWSGDIRTGFPSMAEQRARMITAIAGGESWWTMDTGGFAGHPNPENYARWMQFASVAPIMRAHGTEKEKREPWNYGPQAEAVAKKAIETRYRLLPYLYSGAWQISQHALPLVRPMWLDYSDDPQVTDALTQQWMLGDYLLASPVVDPGATSAKIYLPKGSWIDFWTGQKQAGSQWIERPVDATTWDDLPLYIKRGAIIPTAPPMQYVGEVPIDPLTIEIYPDTEPSSFIYYDDDGSTYDYEKGVYAEIPMTCEMMGGKIDFDLGAQKGTYVLPTKTCVLKFHLLDTPGKASAVTVDGKALAQVDSTSTLDTKGEGWTTGTDNSGPIVLVRTPMKTGKIEVTLQ